MTQALFVPQVSYGDLRFDMTQAQVTEILGEPFGGDVLTERFPYDKDDLKYVKGVSQSYFEKLGDQHGQTELTFLDDKLVAIQVLDSKGPLEFRGIDLFAKDRKAVLEALFEIDKDLYDDGETFMFGELGLIVVKPQFWKQYHYVRFIKSEYEFDRLDFRMWDELDELE